MLTGVSFAIKDRRVDRMLSAEHLTPTEIYYSPLSVWFFAILYLCLAGGWIIFAIPFAYKAYILTGYLVAGYLCSAYMNCSFALTWWLIQTFRFVA